ncbi:MAG TPA: hypothetical protein VM778_10150 [Gemmatimonadota bacterium]|nr:hypothetical protein [Gemmatimonadota bacterium]
MKDFRKPLRRVLIAVAVLGIAGCENGDAPLQPTTTNPALKTVNGVTFVPLRSGRSIAAAGERVQGKSGTTISLDDATLVVKSGSLSVPNATITMDAVNDGYLTFQFGPNGLAFSPAATLTISAAKANLDGLDPGQLRIAGASDSVDDWQVVGGTYDPLTNTVTVAIDHFSRYALCIE